MKLSPFSWLDKQTDLHTVLLCLYVADPATCLASDSVLGTLFTSENSLFIQIWKRLILLSLYYYLINTVNIIIQVELHSASLTSNNWAS